MIKDLNDLDGPSKCNYMYHSKREAKGNVYLGRREGNPIPEAGNAVMWPQVMEGQEAGRQQKL